MTLFSEKSPEFHRAVHLLRTLPPEYRVMALHAAMFWSDEKLDEAESNGDLPGRAGELARSKLS
jgi:hypothetical protein